MNSGMTQMQINLSVNAQSADATMNGEILMPAGASTIIDRSLESVPERHMIPPARFELLIARVKNDMACIDMDEAVRERLNDLLGASKAFASVVHSGELHEGS